MWGSPWITSGLWNWGTYIIEYSHKTSFFYIIMHGTINIVLIMFVFCYGCAWNARSIHTVCERGVLWSRKGPKSPPKRQLWCYRVCTFSDYQGEFLLNSNVFHDWSNSHHVIVDDILHEHLSKTFMWELI
jgi:hypothetical protein